MTRTIAITNLKGGVAKSITAINLGAALARRDATVLIVDADVQGRLALWMDVTPPATLYEVVARSVPVTEAIAALRPTLHLLASGGERLTSYLLQVPAAHLPDLLAPILRPLHAQYDYILLDCAPGVDPLAVAAYTAAQEVIIPATTNRAGADGLEAQLQSVERLQAKGYPLRITAVVPTIYDAHQREHRYWLAEYQAQLPMTTDPIREDARLQEQPRTGRTIFELAPRSRGAEDYARLAERIARDGA